MDINIEPSWKEFLQLELNKDYFIKLAGFLDREYDSKQIYPPKQLIFNAFEQCPLDKVKVVIIGQDPYHEEGQSHGLCFSVNDGVAFPPSLRNIFKEIDRDLEIPAPLSGNLTHWARQGVLLLNATMTVEAHKAGSHQKHGWEIFTDAIIHQLAAEKEHIVFMLWGAYAQKKGDFIDKNRHFVLKSVHPSPLSAYRGFIGNNHFSLANAYLKEQGLTVINW